MLAPRRRWTLSLLALALGLTALASRGRPIDPPAKALSRDLESAAQCRCALAELRIRQGKPGEARDLLAPLIEEAAHRKGSYRRLALYLHGIACFQLGDHVAAGRSLDRLAPFTDAHHGLHARYLLARVYQELDELPEAAVHYEGVLESFEAQHKHAEEALRHHGHAADPEEKARLQAIVDRPAPEFVARAGFCLGVLRYEQGRFEESQKAFTEFLARQDGSDLRKDAQLCMGMIQVQLGKSAEAFETLRPLARGDDVRAANACYWLGKALAASAKAVDADTAQDALAEAGELFRRAAELFGGGAKRQRRGEALWELAVAQQASGRPGDSLQTLRTIADEGLLPGRGEDLLQRQLTAANLAGKYQESEMLWARFVEKHPASPLRPEADFRHAENARFLALAERPENRDALLIEATKRYRKIVESYPEFELLSCAQHELAMAHFRKGEYDRCREILERIPFTERRGPLAAVSFVLADCLIRTAPSQTDDALTAGQLQEQLQAAIDLLNSYVEDRPEPAMVPEALLRLGFCKERLSAIQGKPEDHDRLRDAARADFERLLIDYPLHELQAHAALERSRCLDSDDPRVQIDRLRRFTREPLRNTRLAPLAMLRLASLLRTQDGGAKEAAQLLARCRQEQEKLLQADPARAKWVPLLHFHHAIALSDAGRPRDAGTLLGRWLTQFPDEPLAAEAGLRLQQCRLAESWATIDRVNQGLENPDLKPEETAKLKKERDQAWQTIRAAAETCVKQADVLGKKNSSPDIRAALLYQAAWTHRSLAEPEVNAAREKIQDELRKKLQEEAARKATGGQPAPEVAPPEAPLSQVPLQPEEKKARDIYARLLREMPEHPLAQASALELAELHADREDHAAAIKLLKDCLDREPAAELADRLRMRLAMCSLAKNDEKTALLQFEMVAGRPDSPQAAQAHLRAAECLLAQEKWKEALKHLVPFRDREDFRNLSGLSDRALLLLGHTLSRLEKWDNSRTAFALLVANFGQGPFIAEAHYRSAWTYFKQNKPQDAIQPLEQIDAESPAEVNQKARLLRAICDLERKKHAQAIELLSDLAAHSPVADVSALAMLELSYVCALDKKPAEAEKLLNQVIKKHPYTPWDDIARERLQAGKDDAAAPHTLAAAQRLLAPTLLPRVPLEPLGQMQSIDPSTDDPTFTASLEYALSNKPPERTTPAPPLRLGAPDPFEHREAMQGKLPHEDAMPVEDRK